MLAVAPQLRRCGCCVPVAVGRLQSTPPLLVTCLLQLTFSKEYTAAVEAKQVAQQEAERAKFIVSTRSGGWLNGACTEDGGQSRAACMRGWWW